MPYVSPEEMILDEDIEDYEDYENYEDNEDDIVMLDPKIKAKANDVFERILESYGYNNTEFTEDELKSIKYKIYHIFLYIPDKAKKTKEIDVIIANKNDNYIFFEETYIKKVITNIENKHKQDIDLIKNIKTVLYDTTNVTEDNDPSIINPKQKTVKDVNIYFRDFLKKNIIDVTDSDDKVDIEYDTKDFLEVSKISNIKDVASFINKKEYRLFAFLQYIYNIDKNNTKHIDSYWYWFLKQHIKKFVEKDKINADLTWYDTNFYIYDYTKDNKNKVDKNDGIRKFINAISVFEFGTLLLSRYHITNNTNNAVKGFSEKDKTYEKLLTIDENTMTNIVKPVKADEDSTKIIYGLRTTTDLTFLSDKAENEKGRKRFKIKLYASLKIYDKYLQRKVIVANSPINEPRLTSDYENVIHFLKTNNTTKNPKVLKNSYYISTYNINQKNIKDYLSDRTAHFPKGSNDDEQKAIKAIADTNSRVDIKLLADKHIKINFFQEVSFSSDEFPNYTYQKIDKANIDKKITENVLKTNILKFISSNNIRIKKDDGTLLDVSNTTDRAFLKSISNIDNWNFEIPIYSLEIINATLKSRKIKFNKKGFFITNRLASFDKKNSVKKHNGFTFNKSEEFDLSGIKIGKLGLSIDDHRTHLFIAIPSKDNKILYINIHLDTNDSDRKQQLELIFLLNKIIPSSAYKTYDKIIIAGDFNMDVYEIVNCITRVKNEHYVDKRFLILNNNIITKAGNTLKTKPEMTVKKTVKDTPKVGPPSGAKVANGTPKDGPSGSKNPPSTPKNAPSGTKGANGTPNDDPKGLPKTLFKTPQPKKPSTPVVTEAEKQKEKDRLAAEKRARDLAATAERAKKRNGSVGGKGSPSSSDPSADASSIDTNPEDEVDMDIKNFRKKFAYDSLDNCIIIEKSNDFIKQKLKLFDEYRPNIFVNSNTNGLAKTDKSDHSLVLFEILDPVVKRATSDIEDFDPNDSEDFRISHSDSDSISLSKERRKQQKILEKELEKQMFEKEQQLRLLAEREAEERERKRLLEEREAEERKRLLEEREAEERKRLLEEAKAEERERKQQRLEAEEIKRQERKTEFKRQLAEVQNQIAKEDKNTSKYNKLIDLQLMLTKELTQIMEASKRYRSEQKSPNERHRKKAHI